MDESRDKLLANALPTPSPFRTAALRGLGVFLPPLLTLVILLWVVRTVAYYVLEPVASGARSVLVWSLADIRDTLPGAEATADPTIFFQQGAEFKKLPDGYIPLEVYRTVSRQLGRDPPPATARETYMRYMELTYLRPWMVYPVALWLFLVVLYLVGKFFAVGIGRFVWGLVERLFHRVPLVRTVYSSVKQVTDFMFSGQRPELSRVVAVEYPAKGLWTVAFVTGEGLADVQTAAGEATLSVLIPTNPAPLTGYTAIVKRSEVIDLDLTIDQACEYIISCGVVVPPHQGRRGDEPALPNALAVRQGESA